MPAVNQADAFVQEARIRLLTVASLPAYRAWQNQRAKPPATASWVEDMTMQWDDVPYEMGADTRVVEVQYGVLLHVPVGQDMQTAVAVLHDVREAFYASPLLVNGFAAEVIGSRMDGARDRGGWLAWPLALSFFHSYI